MTSGRFGPARALVRWLHREEGFSLLEAMASVALMAIALVYFASMLSSTAIGQRGLSDHTRARIWVITQVESIKAAPYEKPVSGYGLITVDAGYTITVTGQYWTGSLWQSDPALDAGMEKIRVSVTRGSATLYSIEFYKEQQKSAL